MLLLDVALHVGGERKKFVKVRNPSLCQCFSKYCHDELRYHGRNKVLCVHYFMSSVLNSSSKNSN
jgi:hypothetical protein